PPRRARSRRSPSATARTAATERIASGPSRRTPQGTPKSSVRPPAPPRRRSESTRLPRQSSHRCLRTGRRAWPGRRSGLRLARPSITRPRKADSRSRPPWRDRFRGTETRWSSPLRNPSPRRPPTAYRFVPVYRIPRATPDESPKLQKDRGGRHRDEPEDQDPNGPRARVAEGGEDRKQDGIQAEDFEQAPHGDPGETEGEREVGRVALLLPEGT